MSPNAQSFNPHRDPRPGPPKVGHTVVSARMDDALVRELDDLARRTGRSRGFYLRAALQEMLPVLRERYWAHDVQTRRDELHTFNELTKHLDDNHRGN